jgi:hypothetical protein
LTPLGYFDLLRGNSDAVIVLDDVSSLFREPVGQQLLLASLGTQSPDDWTRTVKYRRRGHEETVHFSGGLVAISNLELHSNSIMDAIRSRTKPLSWNPSDLQLAALMREAVAEGWQRGDTILNPIECREVVEFVIEQCRHYNARMDLRLLFDGALPDFAATKLGEHEVDWRDHAVMAICQRVKQLKFSGPAKTRAERIAMETKLVERIRAEKSTRREQVEAWYQETAMTERTFDRRSADLRLVR